MKKSDHVAKIAPQIEIADQDETTMIDEAEGILIGIDHHEGLTTIDREVIAPEKIVRMTGIDRHEGSTTIGQEATVRLTGTDHHEGSTTIDREVIAPEKIVSHAVSMMTEVMEETVNASVVVREVLRNRTDTIDSNRLVNVEEIEKPSSARLMRKKKTR